MTPEQVTGAELARDGYLADQARQRQAAQHARQAEQARHTYKAYEHSRPPIERDGPGFGR